MEVMEGNITLFFFLEKKYDMRIEILKKKNNNLL